MEKNIIELSKRKLIALFIAAVGFVFFSIWFIVAPSDFVNFLTRSEKVVFTIGIIGVVFFGAIMITLFIKLFDKKPGLIIDNEGITDNSNYSSVGLIRWPEIIGIETKKVYSTRFIILQVNNPDDYIRKNRGLKKMLLKQNLAKYGTPITLTSGGLDSTFDELERLISDSYNKTEKR